MDPYKAHLASISANNLSSKPATSNKKHSLSTTTTSMMNTHQNHYDDQSSTIQSSENNNHSKRLKPTPTNNSNSSMDDIIYIVDYEENSTINKALPGTVQATPVSSVMIAEPEINEKSADSDQSDNDTDDDNNEGDYSKPLFTEDDTETLHAFSKSLFDSVNTFYTESVNEFTSLVEQKCQLHYNIQETIKQGNDATKQNQNRFREIVREVQSKLSKLMAIDNYEGDDHDSE